MPKQKTTSTRKTKGKADGGKKKKGEPRLPRAALPLRCAALR